MSTIVPRYAYMYAPTENNTEDHFYNLLDYKTQRPMLYTSSTNLNICNGSGFLQRTTERDSRACYPHLTLPLHLFCSATRTRTYMYFVDLSDMQTQLLLYTCRSDIKQTLRCMNRGQLLSFPASYRSKLRSINSP